MCKHSPSVGCLEETNQEGRSETVTVGHPKLSVLARQLYSSSRGFSVSKYCAWRNKVKPKLYQNTKSAPLFPGGLGSSLEIPLPVSGTSISQGLLWLLIGKSSSLCCFLNMASLSLCAVVSSCVGSSMLWRIKVVTWDPCLEIFAIRLLSFTITSQFFSRAGCYGPSTQGIRDVTLPVVFYPNWKLRQAGLNSRGLGEGNNW